MTESRQVVLPVTGMTCANCVATVERNLKKVDGVSSAAVNLSSERATVEFDPQITGLDQVVARIHRAGYGIAAGEMDLVIQRLSDDVDARRLEKSIREIDGVIDARVNFATERGSIQYIPTILSQDDIRNGRSHTNYRAGSQHTLRQSASCLKAEDTNHSSNS